MLTRHTRYWLPFTQMDAFDAPARTFVRGDGNYLEDATGRRVFDAVSSIWAIASLELFEREGTLAHVVALASRLAARLEGLRAHPHVRDARHVGLMAAVELDGLIAWDVANRLYERGFFTRPIGAAIQFVLPLSTAFPEIDAFFDALEAELHA